MKSSGAKHYPFMAASPTLCLKMFSLIFLLKSFPFLEETVCKWKFHSKTLNSHVSAILGPEFGTLSNKDEYENRVLTMGYFCLLVRFVRLRRVPKSIRDTWKKRDGISQRECKDKVCQVMKQMTLRKTAELHIILTGKGRSRSLRSVSPSPTSQPSW